MNERILAGAVGLLLTCACKSNSSKTMAAIDAEMATFDTAPPALVEAADEDAKVDGQPASGCCSEKPTAVPTIAEEIDSAPATTPSLMDSDTGAFRAINVYLGGRNYDFASQNLNTLGVEWASEKDGSQIGYEASFWYTPEDDIFDSPTVEAESWELAVGARRTFRRDKTFRPYLGAGVNWLNAEITTTGGDDDNALGLYLHLGAMWKFGEMFGLGVDYRASNAWTDADLGGGDTSINYDQVSVLLSFQF
jgi:opacity protein-like surface antigen